jgi:hypothetical protein
MIHLFPVYWKSLDVYLDLLEPQGGLLMPIKEGGKLRSPRSHAAAIRQEVSEYWDVDWANIKLVFIPLCDGKKFPQMFFNLSLISALAFGNTDDRLQKTWRAPR